jgi:branched-chain amino acid aminotransferase
MAIINRSTTLGRASLNTEPKGPKHPMEAMKKVWMDGKFVDWKDANIHILTHALHYGYAVFEGMRCFTTPSGPAIFRLPEHIERFQNSAKIYRMDLGHSGKELAEACVELVRLNGVKDVYIRPIAYSAYGEMGLNPLKNKISLAIASWEWGPYLGKEAGGRGVRATVSSWVRIDSRALPIQAKCSANYANSALAKMEALAAGYDEAIMLNSHGDVAEGPGENIFRVKDNVLSTPPASSGILRGITRDTIIQFARDLKITFYRNDSTKEELYTSDELFFCGTAAGIAKIREVDGRRIGYDGVPITDKLHKLYDGVVHGKVKRYSRWLTNVKA